MGTDLTAILISSVFLGVGSVIAKFFPEASLMAAVFLIGLAILNVTLYFVAWRLNPLEEGDEASWLGAAHLPLASIGQDDGDRSYSYLDSPI